MNRLLKASALVFGLMTAACASAPETRITTRLAGSDFNSISSQYSERPTFVSILPGKTTPSLLVRMEPFNSYNPTLGIHQPWSISFEQAHVDEYLVLIDKYFEWEKLAFERGDAIEKAIGESVTGSGFGAGTAKIKFEFYSASAVSHHLAIYDCTTACRDALHFSKANAIELRRLLVAFRDGKLRQLDVDSVYN